MIIQFFYLLETVLDIFIHQKEKLQAIELTTSHVLIVVRVATPSNTAMKSLVTQNGGALLKKPRKKINHVTIAITKDDDSSISHLATTHVALTSNLGMSSTYFTMKGTWIIDTGSIDHMRNYPHHQTSIHQLTQQHISTANGGISLVTCEGSVSVSHSLLLRMSLLLLLSLLIFYLLAKCLTP